MEKYVIAVVVNSSERNYNERVRLQCLRDVSNPFELAEVKYRKLFRLTRLSARDLIEILRDPRLHDGHIPKHIKVLVALIFFAQGSYQTHVGQDNILAMSQPSVSRCIALVVDEVLSSLTPQHIKFPATPTEKESAKAAFLELFNIPNTLGVVDGTHVAIAKPPNTHPTAPGNLFFNRKGYYSINCQIICSAKGKIIGVNPNYPGSTHDAAVWRLSKVCNSLYRIFLMGENNQWLLGDKGYPLQPWLLIPITEPTTIAEVRYNECHAKARNITEMCNGRIKNKFRCLHRHRCLHFEPLKAAKIVVTCCTLYNMYGDTFTDDEDEIIAEEDEDEQEDNIEQPQLDFLPEARAARENLIRYFN